MKLFSGLVGRWLGRTLLVFLMMAVLLSGSMVVQWPGSDFQEPVIHVAQAASECLRPSSTTDHTGGNTSWDGNGNSFDTTTCSGPDTTSEEGLSSHNVNYDPAVNWNWTSNYGSTPGSLKVKVMLTSANYSKNSWGIFYTTDGSTPTSSASALACITNCNGLSTSSANTTNVTQAVFEASLSAALDLNNLKVGLYVIKGGGGGDASADVQIYDVWTEAETVNVSISVSDGTVTYGTLGAGASQDTTASGLGDTQTATNNGDVTEDFNIRGQNTGCAWTLAASAGSDQYVHEFSTNSGGDWTPLTTSYQSLAAGVASTGTQEFDLKITVPTSSSCGTEQAVNVTVQAVQS